MIAWILLIALCFLVEVPRRKQRKTLCVLSWLCSTPSGSLSETSIVSFLVVSMMLVVQLRRIATKPLSGESQVLPYLCHRLDLCRTKSLPTSDSLYRGRGGLVPLELFWAATAAPMGVDPNRDTNAVWGSAFYDREANIA